MSTLKRFEDETEYWLQQLFEAWDDVFQAGALDSEQAMDHVAPLDIPRYYRQHIADTWED